MPELSQPRYRDWLHALTPGEVDYVRPGPSPGRIEKLVFDLASTCNMGCSYCFADRGRYGARQSAEPKLLSVTTAASIIGKVVESCSHVGHIKFFGGEPLLNSDAIAATCEACEVACAAGQLDRMPTFNIITNGTVFSDRIADILRKYAIRMTISVDGPKDVHDAQRTFTNGRGTFDRIAKNIVAFHRAGCRLGVLEAVFTPTHIASGFSMRSLYEALGSAFPGLFEIIVVHPLDQPTLNRLPESEEKQRYVAEMREQTRELYEHLISRDASSAEQFRFGQMMKLMSATTRDENLCGVGYDTVTVKPDASVYSCYVFSEDKKFKYGNILSDDFWRAFHGGELFPVMENASRFKHQACSVCDVQKICTHCLSGMTSEAGLAAQLPDVNCDFFLGQVEGFFEALQLIADDGRFTDLCAAMEQARPALSA